MEQGLSNRLENIIGSRMPDWTIRQLTLRSNKNLNNNKLNQDQVYLQNKTGWVRLVSSIDIVDPNDIKYFQTLGANNITIEDPQSLAKQFVLFGGVSAYKNQNNQATYQQRGGVGGASSAYGILGNDEIKKYGYKPMPGITDAKIVTQGKLGSLRGATINFKVWDKDQLDIIDALYFKLGYTMFLEWGNTFYYKSTEPGTLRKGEEISIDPFQKDLDKDTLRYKITKAVVQSEGNYDAMLGLVTNFTFEFTEDGGYNCSISLQSLGVLGDNLKINQSGPLGRILTESVREMVNVLNRIASIRAQKEAAAQNAKNNAANPPPPPPEAKDPLDINTYPPCVRGLGDRQESKDKIVGIHPDKDSAMSRYVFYNNGRYAYTAPDGKITKGNYSCENVELNPRIIIDGKYVQNKDRTTYKDFIDSNQNYEIGHGYIKDGIPNQNLNVYRIISDKDSNKQYLALDKYNTIIPIEYDKPIKGTIDLYWGMPIVTSERDDFATLPALDAVMDDEIFNSYTSSYKKTKKITYPYGAYYKADARLQLGRFNDKDYDVTVGYSSIRVEVDPKDKKNYTKQDGVNAYFVRLEYDEDAKVKQNNINQKNESSRNANIQTAISNVLRGFTNTDSKDRIWDLEFIYEKPVDIDQTSTFRIPQIKVVAKIIIAVKDEIESEEQTDVLNKETGRPVYRKVKVPRTMTLPITVTFNDINLIKNIQVPNDPELVKIADSISMMPPEPAAPTPPKPETAAADTSSEPPKLDVTEVQTEQAQKYSSAIEVILRTLQVDAFVYASTKSSTLELNSVIQIPPVDNSGKLKPIMSNLFSNKLAPIDYQTYINGYTPPSQESFEALSQADKVKVYAAYGYHAGLLSGKQELRGDFINKYKVDYSTLMARYIIPYKQSQNLIDGSDLSYPVYIPLGFFIMALNHSSLLYVTKDNESVSPIIYVDYNQESNLCLTTDKTLTTDPYRFFVPFEGTTESYRSIFDGLGVPTEGFWNPKSTNPISTVVGQANPFRVEKNVKTGYGAYRGKVMNVLVNIDYLLRMIKTHASADSANSVNLKPLLEEIISDMGKCLGGTNIFRLGFNDDADCFFISDDQIVPAPQVMTPDNQNEIPLYGINSIAKSINIKTEVSSKLSNLIALSANSKIESKATEGKDGGSFGAFNSNYSDRYKKDIEVLNTKKLTNKEKKAINDTIIEAAKQFDNAIQNFYAMSSNSEGLVNTATNYYIDKMAVAQNNDLGARASAMIPVSLNFSTDGIGGLGMYNGFTINNELLPYTYKRNMGVLGTKDNNFTVGFIIVGLDHTLSNNTWTTDVRANMAYIKSLNQYAGKTVQSANTSTTLQVVPDFYSTSGQNTNFVASNEEAKQAAEAYLGRTMTAEEWSELVAATGAEASDFQLEEASVMGVILNRVKKNYGGYGATVQAQLRGKNQFESVTGRDTSNFINGPRGRANSIYGAAKTLLATVPKSYLYFTSANRSLFYDSNGNKIAGRDSSNYDNAVKNYTKIGGSYFG